MNRSRDSLLAWWGRNPSYVTTLFEASTEEEFDAALERRIEEAIAYVEANAKDLDGCNENAISTTLAGRIEMPGMSVVREGNSNGHVDITIEVNCMLRHRKRLGEAKKHNGPKYHIEGLKQLIDRYTTGRERTGYVFDYVESPGIEAKMTGIKDEMNACLPCDQAGESTDHPAQWAFTSLHNHRSGVALRVVHFGVNMCWK